MPSPKSTLRLMLSRTHTLQVFRMAIPDGPHVTEPPLRTAEQATAILREATCLAADPTEPRTLGGCEPWFLAVLGGNTVNI